MTEKQMKQPLDHHGLDQLFSAARTYPGWLDKDVDNAVLQQLYGLTRWGPTSMNIQPMRLVFVKSNEAREKLVQTLSPGNVAKVQAAPVTVIIAQDMAFYQHLDRLAPHLNNAADKFRGNTKAIEENAIRNTTLQGGYLLLAARALGLDTGPMSGFDKDKLNQLFFSETSYQANFLMNLGYGDDESLRPRAPRFEFDEACEIV